MLVIFLSFFYLFCFLLGMILLRTSLFKLSGGAMERLLRNMTSTPFLGFIAGIILTAILQSSSAVMVITVGLVSAHIIRFSHSIGIILGTNVGTTITLGLFTLDLKEFIVPIFIIGFIFFLIKQAKIKNIGLICMSIATIFTAMNGFETLAAPLTSINSIQNYIAGMKDQLLLPFFTGTIITSIIQSSTVMTGITMSLLQAQAFSLESGIAIMLGANIGTCVTALIASIGTSKEAKLTAYAHVWLNMIGAIFFLPFATELAILSSFFSNELDVQLAMISVLFNIVCSIFVLPFSKKYAALLMFIHRTKLD